VRRWELNTQPHKSNSKGLTTRLVVTAHFINCKPRIHSDRASEGLFGGLVRATSGDGHLLIHFLDGLATAAEVAKVRAAPKDEPAYLKIAADIRRFVCNPLSGELFRLPDIDGMKQARD
jgi:hypothetical protein